MCVFVVVVVVAADASIKQNNVNKQQGEAIKKIMPVEIFQNDHKDALVTPEEHVLLVVDAQYKEGESHRRLESNLENVFVSANESERARQVQKVLGVHVAAVDLGE